MDSDIKENSGSPLPDPCKKRWPKFSDLHRDLQCIASVPFPQNSWFNVTQVDYYGNIVAGTVNLCSDFAQKLYSGGMSNYTLYDLNSPAYWFDSCGILQQTFENDNMDIEPEGAYLPSTVWTDYTAMFSDYLMLGPLLSKV